VPQTYAFSRPEGVRCRLRHAVPAHLDHMPARSRYARPASRHSNAQPRGRLEAPRG